ncbi:hypothetical protein WMY93_032403 [Mugilogobius chulae]|uniref:UPAR/Ly6 domain-containing protein n=1 Tax=Mugilogobius chulae TaxID=88201 RepID=A0AAW0MP18_9GOBI
MKTSVQLLASVALFLCFHSAAGLQCLSCSDSTCSSQTSVNCSSWMTHCQSQASYASYNNFTHLSCAYPLSCKSAGSELISYTYGSSSFYFNTACCNSNDCNTANLSAPSAGSLQCYSCDSDTHNCTSKVTCRDQELCFQTNYNSTKTLHGCASEGLCSDYSLSRRFFREPLSCCNTSLCNGPVAGLQCWTCSDHLCSSETLTNCSSEATHCVSNTFESHTCEDGVYNYSSSSRGCAPASLCTAAGSHVVSYKYGSRSYGEHMSCCQSDLCNDLTGARAPSAGSLRCYSCNPYMFECSANVSCDAREVCAYVHTNESSDTRPFFGCVSENLCNNPSLSQKYFDFNDSVSCCNTSNCNVPDLGLQCMKCTDSSCSSQTSVICSKQAPFCYSSASTGSYSYSAPFSSIRKGCADASVCTAAGSQFVSSNHGSEYYMGNVTCCDTDFCNAPNVSVIPAPPAGSLQCYGCDSYTKQCSMNVTCSVMETCSSASGKS